MLYLDLKYLHFIQNKLEGFTRKKDNVFLCRCHFCGDSRTDKNKKRGYIYSWKDGLKYKCHNCGICYSFQTFLKGTDIHLYEQYKVELFKEMYGTSNNNRKTTVDDLPVVPTTNLEEKFSEQKTLEQIFNSICKPLSSLPADNIAVKYCTDRKIPKAALERLYFIDDTMKLKQLDPDLDIKFSEQRMVLPFLDKTGKLIGLTCRALGKTKLRYMTVKLSETPQVFGLDKVDPTKTIYVVEGPIDSLFLPNSIAVTGTAFGKVRSILAELNIAPDQVVLILDNQPRNKEVSKILSNLIDGGFNVVVWGIDDTLGKDINELILNAGMTTLEVLQLIKKFTTRGLEARMKFIQWKKC